MNQQTFFSFKNDKSVKNQANTDNFSGIQRQNGKVIPFWFSTGSHYSKASLLRLLGELSYHRYEKRDILFEDEVERH